MYCKFDATLLQLCRINVATLLQLCCNSVATLLHLWLICVATSLQLATKLQQCCNMYVVSLLQFWYNAQQHCNTIATCVWHLCRNFGASCNKVATLLNRACTNIATVLEYTCCTIISVYIDFCIYAKAWQHNEHQLHPSKKPEPFITIPLKFYVCIDLQPCWNTMLYHYQCTYRFDFLCEGLATKWRQLQPSKYPKHWSKYH